MSNEGGKRGSPLQILLYKENAVDWKKQLVQLLNHVYDHCNKKEIPTETHSKGLKLYPREIKSGACFTAPPFTWALLLPTHFGPV